MTRRPSRIAFVFAGALALATPAVADQPARTGFAAGFGLGGGSVSWTWSDGDRRAEESGAGNARLAWALGQSTLVGVEAWAWAKDYEIGATPQDIPVDVTVWAVTAAVTYFPGNTGFFLRGGLGVGGGKTDVTPAPGQSAPITSESATGASLLGAMGYEFGLTSRMALGAAAHAVYIGIDTGSFDNVLGYGLTAQLDWYW